MKEYYKTENGKTEVQLDNYIIDVINDGQLIEIQTKNFSQIREKLVSLLESDYLVKLVHPIQGQKIFRTKNGDKETVRTSPKKENLLEMFYELIYIPELFSYTNFTFEIVFTKIEVVRRKIKPNKFKNLDKKLIELTKTVTFSKAEDFLFIIPYALQKRLTTKSLMIHLGINYSLASKIIYFFAKTHMLECIEKDGNLKIYTIKTNVVTR